MFERMFDMPALFRFPMTRDLGRSSPSVDVRETDSQYIIEAELPGVRKEDIRVQCFEGRTISLDGFYSRKYSAPSSNELSGKPEEDTSESMSVEKRSSSTDVAKEQPHNVLQAERAEGKFFRSFTLPEEIDCSKIDVTFENGLLSIIAPKSEGKRGIPVTINVK